VSRKFAFILVCQGGELEAKSALLAASLRRHLRCQYDLIAAIAAKSPASAPPRAITISLLRQLGARIVEIAPPFDPGYPIGNKIECLRIRTDADKLVFLDSDMLLLRDFDDEPRFAVPFNSRPASCATFTGSDDLWREIYRACGAPPPAFRVRTTYSGEYIFPYFNAGFVAVPGQSNFGDVWLDCCRIIDALPGIPDKRPYLDQIAIGVAAAKLGLAVDCLDERYNHPINFKPLNELSLPFFCHYHDPQTLSREPAALALAQTLTAAHPELREILAADQAWETLLQSPARKSSGITPELIITGIPRSGTSFLSSLLHRLDNCVVLNEPPEPPAAVMDAAMPWGVARLLRDVRRDLLAGREICNKLDNGNVTQDTAVADEYQMYRPRVAGPDFVLGIKRTVVFLSQLPALRKVLPNARFVACVRDPLDTIASWKSTFTLLRDVDLAKRDVLGHGNPLLSGIQRRELTAVSAISEPAARRAAWWRYLAGLVLENREHLILVRYDEMVTQPRAVLQRILDGWPGGNAREPIEPSEIRRRRRESLDEADYAAIAALCTEPARSLGVDGGSNA
jgi:hypothetical protein